MEDGEWVLWVCAGTVSVRARSQRQGKRWRALPAGSELLLRENLSKSKLEYALSRSMCRLACSCTGLSLSLGREEEDVKKCGHHYPGGPRLEVVRVLEPVFLVRFLFCFLRERETLRSADHDSLYQVSLSTVSFYGLSQQWKHLWHKHHIFTLFIMPSKRKWQKLFWPSVIVVKYEFWTGSKGVLFVPGIWYIRSTSLFYY